MIFRKFIKLRNHMFGFDLRIFEDFGLGFNITMRRLDFYLPFLTICCWKLILYPLPDISTSFWDNEIDDCWNDFDEEE